MEKYDKIKKIGRGTYGDVLLVKRKHDGKLLALKKVVLESMLQSSSSSGRESTLVKQQVIKEVNSNQARINMDKSNISNTERSIEIKDVQQSEPLQMMKNSLIIDNPIKGIRESNLLIQKKNRKFLFDEAKVSSFNDDFQKLVPIEVNDLSQNSQSQCSEDQSKNSSEETQKALNNEIQILKTLNHPNIIRYYESFKYKKHLCIVTEYAQNGDLQKKIKEAKSGAKKLSQKQILDWFCQLSLAIGHIHSKNILHRDLKPKNIMLTKNNDIKVGDFGISKMLENTFDMAKTATGTPYYLSPEVCLGQKYDHKSDMWMLGIILYEMCALKRPFEGESLNQVLNKILKEDPNKLSSKFDPIFHQLVDILLQKTASLRGSISEVLDLSEIKENIKKMKIEKIEKHRQKNNHTTTDSSLKMKYVQPMSQKKHSQIKDMKGISINNFMIDNKSTGVQHQQQLQPHQSPQIVHDHDKKQIQKQYSTDKIQEEKNRNKQIFRLKPPEVKKPQKVPPPSAEYQGYQDINIQQNTYQNQQQNQRITSTQISTYIKDLKRPQIQNQLQNQNSANYFGEINDQPQNLSSLNIVYNDKSYSPISKSKIEPRTQFQNNNRSVLSQSSNGKDASRKQKIQELLKKAKKLTSPNQDVTSVENRTVNDSQLIDIPNEDIDSGTQIQRGGPEDQQMFKQNQDTPKRIKKLNNYYLDNQLKNQQKKNWMSAERVQNPNNVSQIVSDQNVTFISDVNSPDEGVNENSFTVVQQKGYNDNSNKIYNQGLGFASNVEGFASNGESNLDISGISSNNVFKQSSQQSEENHVDEISSENIGKRKTIHSMLSVLSLFSQQNTTHKQQHQSQKKQKIIDNKKLSILSESKPSSKQALIKPITKLLHSNKTKSQKYTKQFPDSLSQNKNSVSKLSKNSLFQSSKEYIEIPQNNVIQRNIPTKPENIQENIKANIKQGIIKIKQPNFSEIEVKLSKNKNKINYFKRPEKNAMNAPKKQQNEQVSCQQKDQMLNNSNFTRKSIQINTNLEPGQSKKQYEKALAQAKQQIKQSNKEKEGQNFNEGNDSQRVQKDKNKGQSSISCGNITLINMKSSVRSQNKMSDKIQSDMKQRIQQQAMLLQTPDSQMRQDQSSQNIFNIKKDMQLSQISPGSFYTPNSFYQQPNFKTFQNRFNAVCSEKSDQASLSGKSAASSDTQINNVDSTETDRVNRQVASEFGTNKTNLINKQKLVQLIPTHPKTITNKYLNYQNQMISRVDQKRTTLKQTDYRAVKSLIGNQNNSIQIKVSSQKSSSTNYDTVTAKQKNFVISNNESPFSSHKKQQANTPQDNSIKGMNNLFISNYSGSGDHGDDRIVDEQDHGRIIGNGNKYLTNNSDTRQLIIQQQKRKQISTTTNHQKQMQINKFLKNKKEVITSKSALTQHQMIGQNQYINDPNQQKSKYFTFDQIFSLQNPVNPQQVELLKQRIGSQRYEKILSILKDSDNPVMLLDPQSQKKLGDNQYYQQHQIFTLINNDKTSLQILQQIVNSLIQHSVDSQKSEQNSSQLKSPFGQKEDMSIISMTHTPNSGFTYNSNYLAPDTTNNNKFIHEYQSKNK